jgi:hypothetical protein
MTASAAKTALLPASFEEQGTGTHELVVDRAGTLPALFAQPEASAKRFVEYFTAHV